MRNRRGIQVALALVGAMILLCVGFAGQALACTYQLEFGDESTGAGRLDRPYDVATDSSGNVWVADAEHLRVQKFNSSGEFLSQFPVPQRPRAIDVDAGGDVWLLTGGTTLGFFTVTNPKVREFSPSGEEKLSFGAEGSGNGQLSYPQDLALDSSGNVWVADSENDRVQKFNPSGTYLSQFGKEGTGNGEFKSPGGIAIDSEDNVLVADTGNHRVQEFNSAGEYVRKYGSEGTGNGQFKSPNGIVVDSEERVWVLDSGNNRLQRFSAKGAYQAQFGSYGINDGQFLGPAGIAASGTTLWVADTQNDRVQKLSCP